MNDQMEIMDEELEIPDRMNVFQRLGNLIFSPRKLFVFLRGKPTMLFPLIIIAIGAALYQLLLFEPNRKLQMDIMYNTYKNLGMNYTPDQIELLVNSQMIGTIIAAPFIIIATWAITTLILYGIYRLVNCERGLKKYFSMMAYISIISVIGMILNALYVNQIGGSITTQITGLSSLLDIESVGIFLYSLSASIDVFNIWSYILYAIGFVYVGGVSKKTSYIMAFILFILAALIGATVASISNNLFGGLLGSFMG